MGTVSSKPPFKRGTRRPKGRRRGQRVCQENTLEIMERLFARRVSISVSGQAKRVSGLEAIVLQLMQKAMSGSARAWRALLKYQEFAARRSDQSMEFRFVDSDYTRAIAKSPSRSADG
jgi:Family of unknown function (DUF5681)